MSVVQSLQRLEQLDIEEIEGLKHLIGSGRGHGSNTNMELSAAKGNSRSLMPNLKRVRIFNCIKLESWFPICCMEGLAQLQTVHIVDLPKLQTIFPVECNLQNLKSLLICKFVTKKWRLGEVLFSTSVAQSLQQLKFLVIKGIDGLKHIIGNGRGDCSNTSILPTRNSPFLMPNLNILEINDCNELESFLPICCVEGLTQLQLLEIVDVPKLRHVFGECDHTDHSSLQYGNQILLPRLESMIFKRLENLIDMCPKNYPARWHSPDEKIVEDCPNFATTSV
ncbi:hypothetical protein VNO77_42886 [Canavalia gladiata]|uniref:Uncharacterized protein n=1 Tax=Canavalia gladiata TaxID=3824 RepID=A0AAN9JWQ6_CANGL